MIYVDINKAVFNSRGGVRLDLYQSDQLHYKPPAYVEFTRLIKPVLQDAWQSLQVPRTLQPNKHRQSPSI